MSRALAIFLSALIMVPLALYGCKGKVEKMEEEPRLEMVESPMTSDSAVVMVEPAQTVATETIPPSAMPPQIEEKKLVASTAVSKASRDKDIQRALKAAGFYSGAIDGKIGPKTKKAVEEFQRAKGLKIDGKVGPRTWSELEKYLAQAE